MTRSKRLMLVSEYLGSKNMTHPLVQIGAQTLRDLLTQNCQIDIPDLWLQELLPTIQPSAPYCFEFVMFIRSYHLCSISRSARTCNVVDNSKPNIY